MLTIAFILALCGFGFVVAHAAGWKAPLWVAVLFLALAQLVQTIPLR